MNSQDHEILRDLSSDVLENLLEGFQVIGPDYRFRYVNTAVALQGRQPREALLGKRMEDVYPGIEATPMFATLRECMNRRIPREMENEFAFPDGSKGWFELRFEPVRDGVGILSLDITERKRAHARLVHLNEVLEGIRSVNQLICRERDRGRLIQQAGELLVAARGFRSVVVGVIGPEGEQLIASAASGQPVPGVQENLDRGEVPQCAIQVLRNGAVVVDRDPPGAPAGHPGAVDIVTIRMEHGGKSLGFLTACLPAGLGADPAEQDLLREAAGDLAFSLHSIETEMDRDRSVVALHQSQKMDALGRLAGGVAHDFNNLLTVIRGYAELLLDEAVVEPKVKERVQVIASATDRASALTSQLLLFSRRHASSEQVIVQVHKSIEEMAKMLRRLVTQKVRLSTDAPSSLWLVRTGAGQLDQIIMNLVVNARDAMPDGGDITIMGGNVEYMEASAWRGHAVAPGRYVEVLVTDTGVGMGPELLAKVFEPFFTTKEEGKGTGLGLATVHQIVTQNGGRLDVSSTLGKGTTFAILLPAVPDELGAPQTMRGPAVVDGNGETILVVDDEDEVRMLVSEVLTRQGYRVLQARDGQQALDACESDASIRLVITDSVLPLVSGPDLARRVNDIRPAAGIILMSGRAASDVLERAAGIKYASFLQKPFPMDVMLQAVRQALSLTASSSET